jgi:hypothetical protein
VARSTLLSGFALLVALAAAGCTNARVQTCSEPTQASQSPLLKAPRNGAQLGGMTIDAGGVSEGGGAPAAAAGSGYGVLRIYVLLSTPGAGLTDAQKSALSATLGEVKSSGTLQAFLRFYYAKPLTAKANAADTVSKISADIAAAKPIVSQYLDIIPFLQAGFLGPWGEWWGGDLEGADFGSDQDLRALKTGVVGALKSAFPSTFIQLRYPRDIATYYADDPQIAFHDDSVLVGDDDGGTFNATKKSPLWPDGDSGKQRSWIKERSARLQSVNAGEGSESTPDVSCDALLSYLNEYRIRVFNAQWPSVITKCADQLKNQLAWSGPLSPGPGGGNGGANGAGGASSAGFGTELGCWATDQRPWQLCNPDGCDAERCRRSSVDATCTMYRASACAGDWPPPGYPGEETVPKGSGGAPAAGGAGGSSHTVSGGSPGISGRGGAANPNGGSAASVGSSGTASGTGGAPGSATQSPAGVIIAPDAPANDGGC